MSSIAFIIVIDFFVVPLVPQATYKLISVTPITRMASVYAAMNEAGGT